MTTTDEYQARTDRCDQLIGFCAKYSSIGVPSNNFLVFKQHNEGKSALVQDLVSPLFYTSTTSSEEGKFDLVLPPFYYVT